MRNVSKSVYHPLPPTVLKKGENTDSRALLIKNVQPMEVSVMQSLKDQPVIIHHINLETSSPTIEMTEYRRDKLIEEIYKEEESSDFFGFFSNQQKPKRNLKLKREDSYQDVTATTDPNHISNYYKPGGNTSKSDLFNSAIESTLGSHLGVNQSHYFEMHCNEVQKKKQTKELLSQISAPTNNQPYFNNLWEMLDQ